MYGTTHGASYNTNNSINLGSKETDQWDCLPTVLFLNWTHLGSDQRDNMFLILVKKSPTYFQLNVLNLKFE